MPNRGHLQIYQMNIRDSFLFPIETRRHGITRTITCTHTLHANYDSILCLSFAQPTTIFSLIMTCDPNFLTVDGNVYDLSNLCATQGARVNFVSQKYEPRMYPHEKEVEQLQQDNLTRRVFWSSTKSNSAISCPLSENKAAVDFLPDDPSMTDETNDTSYSSFSSDLTVEVTPGNELPVHGAQETQEAIDSGNYVVVPCICQAELCCIDSATMVLCPECKCFTPLESNQASSQYSSVGLGLLLSHSPG